MGAIITLTLPSRKERSQEGKNDRQLVVLLCKEWGSTILSMPDYINLLLNYFYGNTQRLGALCVLRLLHDPASDFLITR
jgi:hypothetical protein